MIIYGYRNREIEQASGGFHCMNCGVQRPYKHKKIVRYFTLFFIPLFPLGKLSEYVECQVCRRTYHTEILSAISTTDNFQGMEEPLHMRSDPFSPVQQQKKPTSKSCLIRGLTMGGGLSLLLGCVVAVGATLIQINLPEDREGYLAFMTVCPAPMLAVGFISLIAGLLVLFRERQVEEA